MRARRRAKPPGQPRRAYLTQRRHTIEGISYNVFCYADDILICSNASTVLQKLIDLADAHMCKFGLSFNPTKTECVIWENPLQWFLNNIVKLYK